jgi:D-alanyl-D-alanine carboxypeptidase/D-alanyl-D-alanine-endopeptidase (penicillin-binding protein 4)
MVNFFLGKLGQSFTLLLLVGLQLTLEQKVITAQISPPKTENVISACPSNLGSAIEAIIARPEFARSSWGIVLLPLDSNSIIYSLNADKYFVTASNVKLLTTAAALLKLGDRFRLRTSVYGTGTLPNLTSLRIVGRGDPTLTTEKLKELAEQLKLKGVRSIENLIIDDRYFKNTGINPSWEWSDVYGDYAVSVRSLILNGNAVTVNLLPQQLGQSLKLEWSDLLAASQWRVENKTVTAPANTPSNIEIKGFLGDPVLEINGALAIDSEADTWGIAIRDPANYFLESFRRLLLVEGISVTKGTVLTSTENSEELDSKAIELATIESPPVEVLLRETNQESNNLFAEVLLQVLVTQVGPDAVQETLTELGVDPASYQLKDGSGLSRQNLVSPTAISQTLKLMARSPVAEIYRQSLSVAGANGTLKSRFLDTPIQNNLRGKTGTLSGVVALSGYLEIPGKQPLVFSLIVDRSDRPASALRQAIDEIILLVGKCQL